MPPRTDPSAPGVLNWASDLDPNALQQAARTAAMPFVPFGVALMPDAHVGLGSTVGSVFATEGAIIPAAIGVDIGCGMIAARFELTSNDLPDSLDVLHDRIAAAIPAGLGKQHDGNDSDEVAAVRTLYMVGSDRVKKFEKKVFAQAGTLGSGNHFVELCLDEEDHVWLVLHSGSRGTGNKLAQRHIEDAKSLMKKYFVKLDDPDLAYFVQGTDEFAAYIQDMLWAQDYAALNRDLMLGAAELALVSFLQRPLRRTEFVNCHHNFTEMENHRGRNVWVTRKGAVRARASDRAVIPGSMGTRSYIVTGLGNPSSLCSCSHGAGRRMSRAEAKRQFTESDLRDSMKSVSAWNTGDAARLVDEIPASYKDIDQVMADQSDLVRIDHTLHQILNYKGT